MRPEALLEYDAGLASHEDRAHQKPAQIRLVRPGSWIAIENHALIKANNFAVP